MVRAVRPGSSGSARQTYQIDSPMNAYTRLSGSRSAPAVVQVFSLPRPMVSSTPTGSHAAR